MFRIMLNISATNSTISMTTLLLQHIFMTILKKVIDLVLGAFLVILIWPMMWISSKPNPFSEWPDKEDWMVPGLSPWLVTGETKRAPGKGRSFFAWERKNGQHGGEPCRPLMGSLSARRLYIPIHGAQARSYRELFA
jgi:hypothetical protein